MVDAHAIVANVIAVIESSAGRNGKHLEVRDVCRHTVALPPAAP